MALGSGNVELTDDQPQWVEQHGGVERHGNQEKRPLRRHSGRSGMKLKAVLVHVAILYIYHPLRLLPRSVRLTPRLAIWYHTGGMDAIYSQWQQDLEFFPIA